MGLQWWKDIASSLVALVFCFTERYKMYWSRPFMGPGGVNYINNTQRMINRLSFFQVIVSGWLIYGFSNGSATWLLVSQIPLWAQASVHSEMFFLFFAWIERWNIRLQWQRCLIYLLLLGVLIWLMDLFWSMVLGCNFWGRLRTVLRLATVNSSLNDTFLRSRNRWSKNIRM